MTTSTLTALALALALLTGACQSPAPTAAPAPAPDVTRAALEVSRPTPPPASAPAGMPALDEAELDSLHGVVSHVEKAGPYTYIQLDAPSGQPWVVVMGSPEADVGDALAVRVYGTRTHFHSRRLGRQFDQLHFARLTPTT